MNLQAAGQAVLIGCRDMRRHISAERDQDPGAPQSGSDHGELSNFTVMLTFVRKPLREYDLQNTSLTA